MTLEEAYSKLQDRFQVVQRTDFRGEITLELTLAQIEPACKFAKEQLGFNFLSDLSSVDNFGDEPRFEVVYELYSMDRERLEVQAWSCLAVAYGSGMALFQEYSSSSFPNYRKQ